MTTHGKATYLADSNPSKRPLRNPPGKVIVTESRLLALMNVAAAARAWRNTYSDWIRSSAAERDLSSNGENLALSDLLDAIQVLDALDEDA